MAGRVIRPPAHNAADDEIADLRRLLALAMERIDELELKLVRLEVRLSGLEVECSDRDFNTARLERMLNEVAECVTDPENS